MSRNFLIRTASALVFAAIMVGSIMAGPYTYGILFSLILILCMNEYYSLVNKSQEVNKTKFLYKPLGILIGLFYFLIALLPYSGILTGMDFLLIPQFWLVCLLMPFLFFILELFSKSQTPFQNIGLNIIGVIYIGLSLSLVNLIVFENDFNSLGQYNYSQLIGILFIVWVNDSVAYLAGSRWGKTKLFERISPNKTWEGFAGGVAGAMLTAWLLTVIFPEYSLAHWMILAIIVVIAATLGDLIESMLKRSLSLKDSGTVMPGHGGFLDRFDALLFAFPFAALYIALT